MYFDASRENTEVANRKVSVNSITRRSSDAFTAAGAAVRERAHLA